MQCACNTIAHSIPRCRGGTEKYLNMQDKVYSFKHNFYQNHSNSKDVLYENSKNSVYQFICWFFQILIMRSTTRDAAHTKPVHIQVPV